MIRTQIQLTDDQMQRLKTLAVERDVSVASLIRQAVDLLLRSERVVSEADRRKRAMSVAGRFSSGRADVSSNVDEHLVEAFES